MLVILSDITDRKKAEQALLESEEKVPKTGPTPSRWGGRSNKMGSSSSPTKQEPDLWEPVVSKTWWNGRSWTLCLQQTGRVQSKNLTAC